MLIFLPKHLADVSAIAMLALRVSSMATRHLISPVLKFESHLIEQGLSSAQAVAAFALACVRYIYMGAKIVVLTVSLFVAAPNASDLHFARHLGEEAYGAVKLVWLSHSILDNLAREFLR